MSSIIKKFQYFILKFILWMNTLTYKLSSFLAQKVESRGIHPKHRIMNYHKFFIENINKNEVVLDVGCGNGSLTKDVAGKAKKVIGIDIEENNIKKAENMFSGKNIKYICCDALSYFPDETFNVIILSNFIEHIKNRIEFLKKLKNITSKFLIRVPLIERSWIDIYKKELGLDYRLDKSHYIEYTIEGFYKEMKKAGLKIIKLSVQFGEIWAVMVRE